MATPRKKQNYINNKDLLREIHRSKLSYSWVAAKEYRDYDLIVVQEATILTPGQTEMDTHMVKKKGKKELVEETLWPDPKLELTISREPVEDIINGSYTVEHPDVVDEETGEITEKAWVENRTVIQDAKEARAAKLSKEAYDTAIAGHDSKDYRNKPKQKEFYVDPDDIQLEDLVFRVHTYEHIPTEIGRKNIPKKEGDYYMRLNFPPFKHYAFIDGVLTEVARSHWKGDLEDGEVSVTRGRLTHKLGMMCLELAERYSHLSCWRNYTYVDEMRGSSLLQLTNIALQFNEAKSDNPFAYYTTSIKHGFTRVLNIEKKNQDMRDNILIENGHLPSYGRQLDHEEEMRTLRESATDDSSDL